MGMSVDGAGMTILPLASTTSVPASGFKLVPIAAILPFFTAISALNLAFDVTSSPPLMSKSIF
jgi:hypothetical protein